MKAGSKQEEGFGVQPRKVTDLGPAPNLQRNNSSLGKQRRQQYLLNSCEKVGVWGQRLSGRSTRALVGTSDHRGCVSCWAETPVLGASAQGGPGGESGREG